MRREGIHVARWTVERLMGVRGLEGARRGTKKRTTIAGPQGHRARDLVQRKFNPVTPNMLWVADFTYFSTWSSWVYVAFVIDAYSRRILGWRTATTMMTPLVLDAIEHAIRARRREGITDLSGLIQQNDRGSQYTSITFTDRPIEVGIDTSIGATGSRYRQGSRRNDQRSLQDRVDQTPRAVANSRTRGNRHVGMGGLVQPPTTL